MASHGGGKESCVTRHERLVKNAEAAIKAVIDDKSVEGTVAQASLSRLKLKIADAMFGRVLEIRNRETKAHGIPGIIEE
jgi:hypothetical protein